MQLEKAHSSEAGLAGWISSNDVTLFTMVLVVVIALFLHGKLIKGTSENEELTSRNAALRAENQQVEDELQSTSGLLAGTRDTLSQAQQDLDQLNVDLEQRRQQLEQTQRDLEIAREHGTKVGTELSGALKRIDDIMRAADALRVEKSQVERDRDAIEADLTARLNQTRENLTTELQQTRTTMEKDKATLNERLNSLATQLQAKVDSLRDAEAQRDRLKQQADNLDAIVANLEQKLNLTSADMERLRAESATRVLDIENKAQAETARAEDYLARLRRAAVLFKGLQADKANLSSQVTILEDEYQQQVARGTVISRELVGVKGDLRRVAFLFDASGSMKERDGGGGDRWLEAQKIAGTWLAHLDVDECVLVIFSTRVYIYPTDRTFVQVGGAEGEANRQRLLQTLNSVQPQGVTNTLDALRTAYGYEGLDTIVLFTDGAPTSSSSGQFDPAIAQQIYELCRQHPDIPVNTIGIGNYFDQNMSTFLRNVARTTGGTFRGR